MTLDVEIRPDLANKEEDLFPGHGAAAPKAKEPSFPKGTASGFFFQPVS